jgi:hypothetical protein
MRVRVANQSLAIGGYADVELRTTRNAVDFLVDVDEQ